MWVAFANAKATHIFSAKNISVCAIFDDQRFNNRLTNDIISFEQLGPDELSTFVCTCAAHINSNYLDRQAEHIV